MRKFNFDIDITGACNLRCPCCPQGNIKDYRLPQGYMRPELLAQIIGKARRECRIGEIRLFSWSEPLLHPALPELIRTVTKAGISCHLSSNLNVLSNADAVLAQNPSSFRISASGFSQAVYGISHKGGDIEEVKKNMAALAEAKVRCKADTRIYVYYHRYRHNLQDEHLMRDFAADLGFDFEPVWALFFPLEKILGFKDPSIATFPLTEEDFQLIERLAVPLPAALENAEKNKDRPCLLRDDSISIDFQGNVQLCCGIFDARQYTLGNFLEMNLDEIQSIREADPMCSRCMQSGGHVYLTYDGPELAEMAMSNIAPGDAERLGLRHEISRKRLYRRLSKIYDEVFSIFLSADQKAALGSRLIQTQRFLSRINRSRHDKR